MHLRMNLHSFLSGALSPVGLLTVWCSARVMLGVGFESRRWWARDCLRWEMVRE